MEQLIDELKVKIVDILDLGDLLPQDMEAEDPLVGGALGLDSIDVLEMVIMIEKEYGVRIDNRELGEKVFASLSSLAAYISETSPKLSQRPSA
jgi:acyl carrier protein